MDEVPDSSIREQAHIAFPEAHFADDNLPGFRSFGLGNPNTEYGNFTGISPIPTNRSLQNWWNAKAFDVTSPSLGWVPGNQGRDALIGIGSVGFDASLARNFKIKESHRLNVRLDAFNSTNHPNYSTPSTTYLSPTTFGIVTAAGTMRQLQLSAKYSF